MKNIKYIAIMALGIISCEPELDNSIEDSGFYSAGTADFSNFVSIGNSLTAGFADNALYTGGQKNSYPNILANKFSQVGGGKFTQPLVNDNLGGFTIGGAVASDTRLVLTGTPLGLGNIAGTPTTEISNIIAGPFNNIGVPGAKSFHLLSDSYGNISGLETGTANPYFVRMASTPSATMLGDAVAQNPSFFSVWIGNNDILGFATSGGVGIDQTGNLDPTTYSSTDITDPSVFLGTYDAIVTGLTANGAKGVVMNIPTVTSIPYFTTVPYNAIPMDAATAAGTNANPAIASYNGGLLMAQGGMLIDAEEVAQRTISFNEGQNALVIEDESLTDLSALGLPSIRQATNEDLITLPTSSVIGTLADPSNPASVIGVAVPLNDSQVLTKNEVMMVSNAQNAYNNSISMLAAANDNVILVDVNASLNQLANGGLTSNGVTITDEFITGGGFSLDGVHPSARGYAFIANIIMEKINSEFGATIPLTNTSNYPTTFIE